MRMALGIALIFNLYVIIYYRLMAKYYLERQLNTKESTLGALLSFAPHRRLDGKGRIYARRHMIAVAALIGLTLSIPLLTDVSFSF